MAVTLILRRSDIAPTTGVALLHGVKFVGWVKRGKELDDLGARLRGGEVIQGSIDMISREFEWSGGGGTCCEGSVAISGL